MTTTNQPRTQATIEAELDAIEQKGKAGDLTLAQLMSLAKEAEALGKERDALATTSLVKTLREIKIAVPKDVSIRFTIKKDSQGKMLTTASIVSKTLVEAIQAAIGQETLTTIVSMDSIKGLTWEAGIVTLNGGTTRTSTGSNGNGRAIIVNAVEYPSAAAAYRGEMMKELPHPMNSDSIIKALEKAGHSIS
jgi:DnaJ-class molecular chaperone